MFNLFDYHSTKLVWMTFVVRNHEIKSAKFKPKNQNGAVFNEVSKENIHAT